MDSTRPIRALTRGLDALTVLNLRDGATVSEVAQEIRLPRTTVYRILETLCGAGFVYRDAKDERYPPEPNRVVGRCSKKNAEHHNEGAQHKLLRSIETIDCLIEVAALTLISLAR